MVIAEVKRILVVAAETREFARLVRRSERVRRLPWDLEFASEGELGGARVVMVAAGAGPRLAGKAADAAWRLESYDAVLSVGTCGGLDPALRAGDIFAGSLVETEDPAVRFEASLPRSDVPHTTGCVLSVDRVVRSAGEKRRLRSSGAGAVEMEAAAVAARAREKGVPFFCLKAVTDEADEDLLLDYNAARDGEGRLSEWRILREALSRPGLYGKEIWRMYRRSRKAALVLGDFLASCRF